MEETFETIGRNLVQTCLRDLTVYKQTVKTIQSPAIRKLMASIIAQKTEQLADLKMATGCTDHPAPSEGVAEATSVEGWPDPESLLTKIATLEKVFADATRALATRATAEEHKNSLLASAERSLKFASWSQDHLDLLNLF